jgi:hypothetical protein
LLALGGEMAGFWFLGACLAGLTTFTELLVRSLWRTGAPGASGNS